MASDNLEMCGNPISEVLYALINVFNAVNTANQYLGAIVIVALVVLPFYIVYSLKNNNIAKVFISFFGKSGG